MSVVLTKGENINLREDYSRASGAKTAELYRYNGEWKFRALGEAYEGGLGAFKSEIGL